MGLEQPNAASRSILVPGVLSIEVPSTDEGGEVMDSQNAQEQWCC